MWTRCRVNKDFDSIIKNIFIQLRFKLMWYPLMWLSGIGQPMAHSNGETTVSDVCWRLELSAMTCNFFSTAVCNPFTRLSGKTGYLLKQWLDTHPPFFFQNHRMQRRKTPFLTSAMIVQLGSVQSDIWRAGGITSIPQEENFNKSLRLYVTFLGCWLDVIRRWERDCNMDGCVGPDPVTYP